MPRYAHLREDHTPPEGMPLVLRPGDRVILGEPHPQWPDYLWSTAADGSTGWVPRHVLDSGEGQALATNDYSAQELEARGGERVRLFWEAGGWWWCENRDGDRGWLPTQILEFEPEIESDSD